MKQKIQMCSISNIIVHAKIPRFQSYFSNTLKLGENTLERCQFYCDAKFQVVETTFLFFFSPNILPRFFSCELAGQVLLYRHEDFETLTEDDVVLGQAVSRRFGSSCI